jgi:DNA polymerase-1
MIDLASKLLLFTKDFTGRGADRLYWFEDNQLSETGPDQVVDYPGAVVCHDFWIIRDVLFDKTQDLPRTIIDLDEFRMAISGNPEDRLSREKVDITGELGRFGASGEICSAYKKIFNREIAFNADVVIEAAKAMAKMYLSLCSEASTNGEIDRFFMVELPVYRLLQKAMSAGININTEGLSEKRRESEYDYFYYLKNYSDKHDMPLETPTSEAIDERLNDAGFDLSGVSTEYVLEFLPHEHDHPSGLRRGKAGAGVPRLIERSYAAHNRCLWIADVTRATTQPLAAKHAEEVSVDRGGAGGYRALLC